jgi:hypothetical protein
VDWAKVFPSNIIDIMTFSHADSLAQRKFIVKAKIVYSWVDNLSFKVFKKGL